MPVLTKELTSGDQKESHLFKDVQRSLRNRDGLSKRLEPLDISMATSAKRDSSHPSSDSILDSSSSSPSNLGSLTHLVSPGGKGGKKDKASKGDKTPRIGGPGNIFSRLLSNGGKNKLPVFEDETEEILPGPLDEFGNPIKLTRRSSVICSSGRDKYTFDSETVELPLRSIDVYEKQYKKSLSSPTSPRIVSSSSSHSSSSEAPPRGLFQRTPSQLSSNTSNTTPVESSERSSMPRSEKSDEPSSALDEKSSNNNNKTSSSNRSSNGSQRVYQSYGSNSPSPSSSASTSVRFRRDSVVQSAKFGSQRSIMINGKFQNPWETWVPLRFSNILKFGLTKDKSNIPNKEQLDIVLPIVKPSFDNPVPDDGLRITWLGHSTVLLQMDGVTVITDPIFSERASPSQVIGPKRYRDPPCTVHDLPSNLDAVVISHNHYDHLDLNTVTLLNARYAADLRWFVPLGMRNWFEQLGCENVVELDWWEENCVPDKNQVSFVFTPAQHWSKRTLTDDNKSLWGSWTIIGPKRRFFFAGDTGYCPAFKEIGHTFGPFTVAAIPIGAFEPRWFMKSQHVNPEEAVAIHEDIKSKFTLGIHWGTFALANEYYLDPPMKLREALESRNISSDTFVTFKHGESRIVKDSGESVPEKPTRIKYQNRDKT